MAIKAALVSLKSERPRSLFVIGTADQHYQPALLDEVCATTGGERLVAEGANHSLEIPGDVGASLAILERVVRGVAAFLDAGV